MKRGRSAAALHCPVQTNREGLHRLTESLPESMQNLEETQLQRTPATAKDVSEKDSSVTL